MDLSKDVGCVALVLKLADPLFKERQEILQAPRVC